MPEARTIAIGSGRSLHAVSGGQGPDILLVHGALATHQDWVAGPFGRLTEFGRVTAIDRPGHGLSRRPRFEGDPRSQARQIRQALDAMDVERAILVGHSFGALVSLAMAELFPDSVAALVLVAPLAFPEPRLIEHSMLAPRAFPLLGPAWSAAADATIDPAFLSGLQALMFSPQPVPEHWRETFPYDLVLDPAAMVDEGEDAVAILPGSPLALIDVGGIRAPTHIITGTADKIVQHQRQGKLLARLMPDARMTELEGVGHMPHHARPDVVIEAIRQLLAVPQPV